MLFITCTELYRKIFIIFITQFLVSSQNDIQWCVSTDSNQLGSHIQIQNSLRKRPPFMLLLYNHRQTHRVTRKEGSI